MIVWHPENPPFLGLECGDKGRAKDKNQHEL
jgi:hypothetical protein